MVQDNGGAIAQRGFNYQNHVISLVAIRNYCKNKFEIYVESDDDFEVVYDDNYHAYIQVKGMKRVSITRLLQKEKDNCSIFEKHFTSGDQHSKYKIVVFHFNQAELLKMNVNTSEELFERSWKFSAEQTNEILAKLGADFGAKLDNFSEISKKIEYKDDVISSLESVDLYEVINWIISLTVELPFSIFWIKSMKVKISLKNHPICCKFFCKNSLVTLS